MLTSVLWLNDYLDPPCSAEQQGDLLTRAGFPLEGTEPVEKGDIRQDFEMTSNRGDCVCHIGLAREIAALSNCALKIPAVSLNPTGPPAASLVSVTNEEPELCPRYTARIIRGVTVAPSPDWLADRLRARGDIPRNNLVDATNFVLFEMGQPTHVFDLSTLHGPKIIIRRAEKDEPFLPIGEGESEVKLTPADLVIADADRPVAIAGVKGGAVTAVTDSTTDILIETATFQALAVRNTSRRLGISSDSCYRFERGVHPAHLDSAADRLCSLILELCGGELCTGTVEDGAPLPKPKTVSLRPARCRQIIGVDIPDDDMVSFLNRLDFSPTLTHDEIHCTVPNHRLDIEREIDLIEEVSRIYGHDRIPIADSLDIRIAPPQSTELARQAVHNELTGMGFIETTTHSLISESAIQALGLPPELCLRVDDDRAKSTPILRPSALPSLLRVRSYNHDNGVEHLKLFESCATFWKEKDQHQEQVRLGLIMDMDTEADGLRPLRGVLQRIIELLKGHDASLHLEPSDAYPWFSSGAVVRLNDHDLGWAGILNPSVLKKFSLDRPILAADLNLAQFYAQYPPETEAHALPSHPAIERDVSAIIEEKVSWKSIQDTVNSLNLDQLEGVEFITVFRGKQIDAGKKSLTLRAKFRAPDRTLTHDEVDPQMSTLMESLKSSFHAEIRK